MQAEEALKRFVPKFVRRKIRAATAHWAAQVRTIKARLRRPDIYRLGTQERLGIVYNAQTHLSTPERLFLYSIVRGARPQRVLEIGSALGGSAAIIASALEDNGFGEIISIEPIRRVDPTMACYFGRFRLIESAAPDGIEEAARLAAGKFDFVFYDGPNVHTEASNILAAITPYVSERAYIVIDNGFHYGVHKAVVDTMEADQRFHDCGFPCVGLGVHDGHVAYNGLRLLRFESNAVSDPQPGIEREYRAAGVTPPMFDPEVVNHDVWWCKTVRACPKCARSRAVS